jgi:hypothetical protein
VSFIMSQHLTNTHKEFLAIVFAGNSKVTYNQIREIFEDKFPDLVPSDKQIRVFKQKNHDLIDSFRRDDKLSFSKAMELGLLKYSTKLSRICALEKIVHMGIYGYQDQTSGARGQVITLDKKDLPTAIRAINAIKQEIQEVGSDDSSTYQISVELATVPPQEADDEAEFTF